MSLADRLTVAGMELHQDAKGMTGRRSYLVPADRIFDPELPLPGFPWPGPPEVIPHLRCVEANWTEEESGLWRAEYLYSTERQLGDEFAEVSTSWGLETVDQTRGYVWETTGAPVQEAIPTQVPVMEYVMTMRVMPPPYEAVQQAVNKVNDRVFRGFARGTLRFDGTATSESYDRPGQVISCQVVYKFSWRGLDWNYCWRPPLQARDGNGNPRYYQGQDNTKPDYNTALDGQPVYVSGSAGQGGWDRPKLGNNYRYEYCNFAQVLGLPKLPGDG